MSVTVSERAAEMSGRARVEALPGPTGRSAALQPALRREQHASSPVVVDGSFGWLHTPTTHISDAAVLLCPALGWDGLHAHHGFRLLADQFAASGYPALRFQYPGTGDSRDLGAAEESWAAWQHSVHAAADWLRAQTGASRLILVGLRIGAALATLAAEQRADVGGLVLLAPVLRGKSYMRQLDMEARLEGGEAQDTGHGDAAGGFEFHEMRFGAETVDLLSQVDLRRVRLRAGTKVALALQAPSQLAEKCTEAWTTAGLHVASLPFEGFDPLLQNATHADPLVPDFSTLLAWAAAAVPAMGSQPHAVAMPPASIPPLEPLLHGHGYRETPVRFGKAGQLFGILCRPATEPGRMAVIVANTGRDPHYGIGRFGVELARRLAADGVASLRMDFAGLGDSPAPSGEGDALTSLFETDRSADLGAAIEALQALGYRELAVQGLCSGAYHALRSAERDHRIGTLLLVNLPTFEWQGGDSVKTAIWKAAPTSRILKRLIDPSAWKRVLFGQSDVRAILHAQGRRLWDRARRMLHLGVQEASPQHTMAMLGARRVRSLFLYSVGDPGIDTLEDAWGHGGERLGALPGVDLRIVSEINHVLSGGRMRRRVVDHLVSFLAKDGADRGPACRSAEDDNSFDHSRSDDNGRAPAEANFGASAR